MRISLKIDYAVRAMICLAADDTGDPVKADTIARAQDIPLKFLLGILNDLKRARLLRSQRGAEGGYTLAKPGEDISVADVIRAIDGPLANVHDASLNDLTYPAPAGGLVEVWMALRASLREVLEHVNLKELATGELSPDIRALAAKYEGDHRVY